MPRPILHHDTFLTEIFEPLLGGILGQAEKEAKGTSGDETILFQIFLDFLQKLLLRILGRLRGIFRTEELRCHFSEKKAMALLYKLENCTRELVSLTREIVELATVVSVFRTVMREP